MLHSKRSRGEAEDGATNIIKYDPTDPLGCFMPNYCLLHNYLSCPSWPVVKRSYESQLHYMVFKPFNKTYDPDYDAMDHIRKKICSLGNIDMYIIVREIKATKIHYHAMVWSDSPLFMLHEKQTNRFRIHYQEVCEQDKYRVHDYLIKESHERRIDKLIDIQFKKLKSSHYDI